MRELIIGEVVKIEDKYHEVKVKRQLSTKILYGMCEVDSKQTTIISHAALKKRVLEGTAGIMTKRILKQINNN
tara:strand:+ start:198 stop:416 length:219 start_codon:yes stop_codon:yes gene_type:complete